MANNERRRQENLSKVLQSTKQDSQARFQQAKKLQKESYQIVTNAEKRKENCIEFMQDLRQKQRAYRSQVKETLS